jgi:glucose dehydrogenase
MSTINPRRSQIQNDPPQPYPVLQWVMCHPGVLMFSSIALGTMLAAREVKRQLAVERRVETEADIVDGDVPLFI